MKVLLVALLGLFMAGVLTYLALTYDWMDGLTLDVSYVLIGGCLVSVAMILWAHRPRQTHDPTRGGPK